MVIPSLDGSRGGNVERLRAQVRESLGDGAAVEVVIGVRPNGRARNVGAARTRGEILIFVDDDVTFGGPEVLPALVRTLEENPDVGLCGPSQLLPPGSSWWQRRAAREIPRNLSPVVDRLTDSDMVTHMCLAIRRDLWDRIGGEHPDLERGTDPDLRYRVRAAGKRVVMVPGVWAYHPMPPTIGALLRIAWRNGIGAARTYRRFPGLIYDAPPHGERGTVRNVGLPRRVLRGCGRLLLAAVTLRPFLLVFQALYMAGYAAGRLLPLPPIPPGGTTDTGAPAAGRTSAGERGSGAA